MREWKTAETEFLARLFLYHSSIVSQILDFIHEMITICSFDHGLVKTENKRPASAEEVNLLEIKSLGPVSRSSR